MVSRRVSRWLLLTAAFAMAIGACGYLLIRDTGAPLTPAPVSSNEKARLVIGKLVHVSKVNENIPHLSLSAFLPMHDKQVVFLDPNGVGFLAVLQIRLPMLHGGLYSPALTSLMKCIVVTHGVLPGMQR